MRKLFLIFTSFFLIISCEDAGFELESLSKHSLQKVIYPQKDSPMVCDFQAVFSKGSATSSNHDIIYFRLIDADIMFYPENEQDLPLEMLRDGQTVFLSFKNTYELREVHRIGIGGEVTCLSVESQ